MESAPGAPSSAPAPAPGLAVATIAIESAPAPLVSQQPETEKSAEMRALLQHQLQLKEWTAKVNKRIYELEEQYLEETTLGNIVRGWDQDAKATSQRKVLVDERERIFTNSNWSEMGNRGVLGAPKVEKKKGPFGR